MKTTPTSFLDTPSPKITYQRDILFGIIQLIIATGITLLVRFTDPNLLFGFVIWIPICFIITRELLMRTKEKDYFEILRKKIRQMQIAGRYILFLFGIMVSWAYLQNWTSIEGGNRSIWPWHASFLFYMFFVMMIMNWASGEYFYPNIKIRSQLWKKRAIHAITLTLVAAIYLLFIPAPAIMGLLSLSWLIILSWAGLVLIVAIIKTLVIKLWNNEILATIMTGFFIAWILSTRFMSIIW